MTSDQLDIVEALLSPPKEWGYRGAPEAIETVCQQLAEGRHLPDMATVAARTFLKLPGGIPWLGVFCPSCYYPVDEGDAWYPGAPSIMKDPDLGISYKWLGSSGSGTSATCTDCIESAPLVANGLSRYQIDCFQWPKHGLRPDDLGSILVVPGPAS